MNFSKHYTQRTRLSLFLVLFSITPTLAQSRETQNPLEQQKDSLFAILFRSLWIDLAFRHFTDTTFLITEEEKNFCYEFEKMSDSVGPESLLIPVPKYAEKAARYFEAKTGLKRPRTETYFALPYLTTDLLKKWEKWYEKNKKQISYLTFVANLEKLVND